ncbi:META domain [Kingella potus]|uniref:META domain n=1 Tax=Kingella potus TaxID=265175 RepID=A0A377R5Y9_9NEIS|nr:META domain-containing protein [Kingella potus]UOP00636.1 META domain-containing protein [Kingella potus]STR02975.1 META domain [Kingella potus]
MNKMVYILVCVLLAGCAAVSADSEALAGKWKVSKISGEPFKGVAELSFEVQEKMLSSYAGCNRMNTRYSSDGKGRLNFGYTASTRMACASDAAEAEQRISHAFTQTEAFRIGGGRLLLEDGEGNVLLQATRMSGHAVEKEDRPSENAADKPEKSRKSHFAPLH